MSDQPPGGTAQPADSHRGLRLLGLVAVAAGVLLLMAAAFALSYPGIRAVALSAGVSPRFARIYPGIFDAMLVVACAAVLALRGAGLPSRCYAWLVMLALLAAAAGADTLHAMNTRFPHEPAAVAAAIIPWALVLLGFGLLLSMLRHARLRRAMLAAAPQRRMLTQPSGHVEVHQRNAEVQQRHGLDDLFGSRASADLPAVRYVPPAKALPVADAATDLAIESDPGHDDPSTDEGHPAAGSGERQEQPAGDGGDSAPAFSPAPTVDLVNEATAGTARDTDRRTEAGTVPGPRRAPTTGPATKPAAGSKSAAGAKPPAGTRPAAAKSAGETKRRAKAGPGTAAEPAPEAAPEPAPEAAAEAAPAPGAGTVAVAEPSPEAAAEAEQAPRTGPGAGPEATAPTETPSAEPAPVVPLQFDRMRSSPLPPPP